MSKLQIEMFKTEFNLGGIRKHTNHAEIGCTPRRPRARVESECRLLGPRAGPRAGDWSARHSPDDVDCEICAFPKTRSPLSPCNHALRWRPFCASSKLSTSSPDNYRSFARDTCRGARNQPRPGLCAMFAQTENLKTSRKFAALRGAMHENACAANRLRHETTSTRQSNCSPFAPTKNRMFAASEKQPELSRPHETDTTYRQLRGLSIRWTARSVLLRK